MMQRRGFMAAMLAAASAPAIVRAGSLMRINPRIIAPAGFPVDWQQRYVEVVNRAADKLAQQIERDMMMDTEEWMKQQNGRFVIHRLPTIFQIASVS